MKAHCRELLESGDATSGESGVKTSTSEHAGNQSGENDDNNGGHYFIGNAGPVCGGCSQGTLPEEFGNCGECAVFKSGMVKMRQAIGNHVGCIFTN